MTWLLHSQAGLSSGLPSVVAGVSCQGPRHGHRQRFVRAESFLWVLGLSWPRSAKVSRNAPQSSSDGPQRGTAALAPGLWLPACGSRPVVSQLPSCSWAPCSPLIIGVRSTLHFSICNGISFGLLGELFLNNFPFKPAAMRLQCQLTLKGSALKHLFPLVSLSLQR